MGIESMQDIDETLHRLEAVRQEVEALNELLSGVSAYGLAFADGAGRMFVADAVSVVQDSGGIKLLFKDPDGNMQATIKDKEQLTEKYAIVADVTERGKIACRDVADETEVVGSAVTVAPAEQDDVPPLPAEPVTRELFDPEGKAMAGVNYKGFLWLALEVAKVSGTAFDLSKIFLEPVDVRMGDGGMSEGVYLQSIGPVEGEVRLVIRSERDAGSYRSGHRFRWDKYSETILSVHLTRETDEDETGRLLQVLNCAGEGMRSTDYGQAFFHLASYFDTPLAQLGEEGLLRVGTSFPGQFDIAPDAFDDAFSYTAITSIGRSSDNAIYYSLKDASCNGVYKEPTPTVYLGA